MITRCAVPSLLAHVHRERRGWPLCIVLLVAGLFSGPAICSDTANCAPVPPGPSQPQPVTHWQPTFVLKITMPPFFPRSSASAPDASFGPGLAWVDGGRKLAVATNQGLALWQLAHRQASMVKLFDYHRAGFSEYTALTPVGIIQRKSSFGVALFVKGENGANPRLVVDWYARTGAKFLRCYRIHLRHMRNSGVRIAAPADANWFATIPVRALPQSRIHLWRDSDGKENPIRLPPLHGRFNFVFSGGQRNELAWGTPGAGIHVARWTLGSMRQISVSRVPLDGTQFLQRPLLQRKGHFARFDEEFGIPPEIWQGTLSFDGIHMLLVEFRKGGAASSGLGRVTAVATPVIGVGPSEVVRYLSPGTTWGAPPIGVLARPVFSPRARFAAFAVLGAISKGMNRWLPVTDVFLVHSSGLSVMRWARLPEVIPLVLSFSGNGRRLALVTSVKIFVFDLPRSSRGPWPEGLPLTKVKRLPAAPIQPLGGMDDTRKRDTHR